MKYLSVCSGIEAATSAWHPLGWEAVGFSEIEPFPSAVLKHHYPEVPNFGDMSNYREWNLGTDRLDLLVGGTPCQSFSVAGLRKGLADPRGNLALVYCGMLDHFRPRWFVWENVPGVLSSHGGRDFGAFLGAVGELGYGFSYRVLDAQYFGVAQRRRRVFVVGHLGDWRRSAAVLFERESLRRDTAPSREKKEKPASQTRGSAESCNRMVAFGEYVDDGTASAMKARDYKDATDLISYGIPGNWIGRSPQNGGNAVQPMYDLAPNLTSTDRHGVAHPIAFHPTQDPIHSTDGTTHAMGCGSTHGAATVAVAVDVYNQCIDGDVAATLTEACGGTNTSGPKLMTDMAVRRLTPTECERLQGFPDGHTDILWKGKPVGDGARYKALGNSMAVPVMNWIGKRIQMVDNL